MIYGLYLSAAGGQAETARQGVVANNMANVNTPGFKPDVMTFQLRPPEITEDDMFPDEIDPVAELVGGGLFLSRSYTNFKEAPLEYTGNTTDLALKGDGFFNVRTKDGDLAYTRAGNFIIDQEGYLTDQKGNRILMEGGEEVPVGALGDININYEGAVSSADTGEALGRLAVSRFADMTKVFKFGDNLYRTTQPDLGRGTDENATQIYQGYLEGSGANPVTEMVNMINGFRAYEANMQMIRMQDANLQTTVNDVGRV